MQHTASSTDQLIHLEEKYNAHNYHPLPVVLERGEGVYAWDVEGKKYFDFLSAYSALNMGHSHPRLVNAIREQAGKLTLTSRAFHSNLLGKLAEKMHGLFGYDKMLPMNSGAEAVETAIKLCRRWAYRVKGVEENKAKIVVCAQNFHGRTTTIVSFSSDAGSKKDYGPFAPGFVSVSYNDPAALEKALEDPDVAGFLVEPVQGEAGVIVPAEGYLAECRRICTEKNVLMIADEIQTGLCRTGKMLACDHEQVRPDMVLLGKALGGGMLPISAVLADDAIMLTIGPGEHGSTYGGNPLACRVAIESLDILQDENLAERAKEMGKLLLDGLRKISSPLIKETRGKGLLCALELHPSEKDTAWDLCMEMMRNGLLAKPTHKTKIRFAPPLVITKEEVKEALAIIERSLHVL